MYYGGSKTQWESVSGKTASDTFQNARVHYHTLVPHWKLSEILIPATCTREGSGIYVCDCGHTIEQAIPAFGHPPYEPIETVLPTCTTEGYTIYQCPACFDTYHDDVVNPAHTFEDGVCVWCGIATEQCLAATSSDGEPMDQRWTVHQDGMVAVKLAFSSSTALADGAALSIYDGKNTLVGTYTGDQLAGQTVEVPGDTVEIHFVSDGNEASAFAVTQVSVIAPALGDLNRDAVINMTDAFSLYRAASGDTELSARQKEVADINGDGEWNMTDAYSVYRIASGG